MADSAPNTPMGQRTNNEFPPSVVRPNRRNEMVDQNELGSARRRLDFREEVITTIENLNGFFWERIVGLYCMEKGVKYSEVRDEIRKRFDWEEDIISAVKFTPNSQVVVMGCCHYFLEESLKQWFLTKREFQCPVCKQCDEYIEE